VLKVENMTPSAGSTGQVVQVEYWDKK